MKKIKGGQKEILWADFQLTNNINPLTHPTTFLVSSHWLVQLNKDIQIENIQVSFFSKFNYFDTGKPFICLII